MEFVTGVASSVVGKILEYPIRLIGRHLGYLINYQTNIKSLTDQQPELDNKISSVKHRAQAARGNGEELDVCVTGWISEAERKDQEAKDVINDSGHENAECSCNGSFPNLVSRYKLSKKAKIMAENIVIVLRKADSFGNFSYRPLIPLIQPSFKNKDYVAFDTRKQTLKEIMESLKDPDLSMIGVYGMGGVGKTTLIKEVARQAKEEGCFSEVIMVTVSQDVDLKSIQNRIAEGLDLKLEGENMLVRANRLQHRLRQGSKILIILDDIWNELDLSEAGIHFNADDQRECKILLVSRDHDVLYSLMRVRKTIEVKVLSNSEPMSLFYTYVGDKADNTDFKTLANLVVGECGGLPIAIATIACSLENKSLLVWKDTLRLLKRSPKRGVYEKVYSCIKTSYDFLESEEKKLLLLCSLHGEDADVPVDDLMIYGIGWDLFEEVGTMEEARCRVHSLVHKLKARCLLLDGNYKATVRMHDVIRDVMISVAKEDEHMHCFTKVAELEECLHKEDFREYSKAIIILGPDFENQLLPRLVCSKLQLLFAFHREYPWWNMSLGTIPDDFFIEAQELKALSFNCMPLQSLPQSFCTLRHLQALRLWLGEKADLTLIGELMNLIVLDLSRSKFNLLPEQIGKLTRLQSLNLNHCESLRVIQPNVISSLVRLEELYMDGVYIDWEVEGRVGEGRNASLMEFKNLRNLTTLHLNVRDANVLAKDMFSENLQRYRIEIGSIRGDTRRFTGSRLLYLNLRESSQVYQYGIQKLMKNSEGMWLEEFHGVDNIVYELEIYSFPQLKNFCLKNNEVRYIVHSTKEIQPCSAFQNLETLNLENLRNLEKICYGNVKMESFGKLRRVDVSNCDKLKNLFSFSIAQLERLEIRRCPVMEEVVVTNEHEEGRLEKHSFPKLKYLVLEDLPNLRRFCTGDCIECPSLLKLEIENCGVLRKFISNNEEEVEGPFFNEKVSFPILEYLLLERVNLKILWADQLSITSFGMQNLKWLEVVSCDILSHLSSLDVARSLLQLKELHLSGCKDMEAVFITKEPIEEETPQKISFPKLKYLELEDLPNLRRFCTGDCIECPSLLKLEIENCGVLRKFISNNEEEVEGTFFNEKFCLQVSFPILEYLLLERVNLKILWADQLSITSFGMQNLKRLEVVSCDILSHLSSLDVARSLLQLEKLRLWDCKDMEAVLVTKEPIEEGTPQKISFPKLKNLELCNLQNIRQFCAGCCIEFPSLTYMKIEGNPATSTFITDSCKKASGELMGSEAKQPLFNGKVAFPKLEALDVGGLNSVNSLFSFAVAKSLVTLKELQVRWCSLMEEIVQVNEQGEGGRLDKISFPKLERIRFNGLSNLKRFYGGARIEFSSLLKSKITAGKETEEIMDRVVLGPNLEELTTTSSKSMLTHLCEDSEYFENSSLKSLKFLLIRGSKSPLLSSRTSFQNLMALVVSECSAMINLLASSSAKTLVHLRLMSITKCKQMTEIIADEIVDDEIVFSKLEILELSDLPSLRSFHSAGNIVMRFPNLVRLVVSQCPQMRRFSFGTIDAPNLDSISGKKVMNTWEYSLNESAFDNQMLYLPEPEQNLWEGDINKTLEKLWEEDYSLLTKQLFSFWFHSVSGTISIYTLFISL
ncbi:hypothetical protein UlMin_002663 [Ulmus minor]